VPRAPRRCGAPLRHMAPRLGQARGHVAYLRYVMGNAMTERLKGN